MANQIQWYLENRVLYNKLSGNVAIDSIAKGSHVIQDMIAELENTVDIIFDASAVTVSPTHIGQLTSVTESLFASEKIGNVLVISNNPIQRFVGNVILQVFRKQSKVVASLEEAIKTLMQLNPSLPDLALTAPNSNIITVD